MMTMALTWLVFFAAFWVLTGWLNRYLLRRAAQRADRPWNSERGLR